MKAIKIVLACVLIAISIGSFSFANLGETDVKISPKIFSPKGFAVLELFTSEGCSSCPPADALLGKIQSEYADKPVYVLAYHVDYWDRLGWKDAFSDVSFSNRQFRYSQLLQSQQYTPQLVVNGESEFVGSNEYSVNEALAQSLVGSSPELKLSVKQDSDQFSVDYEYAGSSDAAELKIALVQKQAERHIKRGENEGRTLKHFQIVRKLYSFRLDADGKGTKQFGVPMDFDREKWEVIAMIQNPKTGRILAASRVDFLH